MLVAASMPALPAASRNCRSGVLCSAENCAGRGDHAIERVRPVIREVGDDRHHGALGVEEIRVVDRCLLGAVVEDVLVARDREPLRAALVRAGGNLPHRVAEEHRGLHARHLLERPGEPVGLHQRAVLEAAFRRRLHDHRELVARERVVGGDVRVVAVVPRARPQLRRAGVEIADLELRADGEPDDRERRRDADRPERPAPLGEPVEPRPDRAEALAAGLLVLRAQAPRGCGGAHAGVREQHRQQHEVGEDQHRHPDARREGEVLDDRDVDHHQHREADRVGEERGQPGEEEAPERVARRDELVRRRGRCPA